MSLSTYSAPLPPSLFLPPQQSTAAAVADYVHCSSPCPSPCANDLVVHYSRHHAVGETELTRSYSTHGLPTCDYCPDEAARSVILATALHESRNRHRHRAPIVSRHTEHVLKSSLGADHPFVHTLSEIVSLSTVDDGVDSPTAYNSRQ